MSKLNLIGYEQNQMSPQNSLSKKMLGDALFVLRVVYFFPRIIRKYLFFHTVLVH
jgi:hypothetical protein